MSRTARPNPRRADHDALFDRAARISFCAALTGAGVSYNALAADLERAGMPRPSAGSASYRARILQVVSALGRPEVWEVVDRMGQIFDRAAHAASAPPADPEGYAAALVADLPLAATSFALPHPRAAEVAAIIRGWAGEEPRPLWERLRREGWPSLMPVPGGRWLGPMGVEEVARWVWSATQSHRPAQPESGLYVRTSGAQNVDTLTTAARLAASPPFPPLAVWQGSADALALPADLSGWVLYIDGPYWGDGSRKITGYPHGTMSREGQIRLAFPAGYCGFCNIRYRCA